MSAVKNIGEAMEKMLHEKKISNKINYDVLKNLTSPLTALMNKQAVTTEQDDTTPVAVPEVNNAQQLPVVYESGSVNTSSKR